MLKISKHSASSNPLAEVCTAELESGTEVLGTRRNWVVVTADVSELRITVGLYKRRRSGHHIKLFNYIAACRSSSCKPTPILYNAAKSCDSNSSTYDRNVQKRCFWGSCTLNYSWSIIIPPHFRIMTFRRAFSVIDFSEVNHIGIQNNHEIQTLSPSSHTIFKSFLQIYSISFKKFCNEVYFYKVHRLFSEVLEFRQKVQYVTLRPKLNWQILIVVLCCT